ITQDLTIPDSALSARLDFAYAIETQESSTATTVYDKLKAQIINPVDGTVLKESATLSNLNVSTVWKQSASLDLAEFRGQAVRVKFSVTTDGSLPSTFRIDNVELQIGESVPLNSTSTLTVQIKGAGSGTVNSTPPGIACTTGTCIAEFQNCTSVTLLPTPSIGSAFVDWSGVCAGAGNCAITMDIDKIAASTFVVANPLVKLDGPRPAYFTRMVTAYAAAGVATPATLQAQEGDFSESLVFAQPTELTLTGGYDNTFTVSSGYSRLLGDLTIADGSLAVDRLIIGPASGATLEAVPPVMQVDGTPPTYHTTFEVAYDSIPVTGTDLVAAIIRAGVGTISGNLNLNRDLALTLLGGLDSTLTRAEGYLHIKGSLVIAAGSLVVDRIVIE
ncbi:MAG: hypothetical protein Q7V04_08295, partial [Deltaproteobacteria bacterium]|nr:hypothetical protein [Deltaproteobacteria bacterium]